MNGESSVEVRVASEMLCRGCYSVTVAAAQFQISPAGLRAAITHRAGNRIAHRLRADDDGVTLAGRVPLIVGDLNCEGIAPRCGRLSGYAQAVVIVAIIEPRRQASAGDIPAVRLYAAARADRGIVLRADAAVGNRRRGDRERAIDVMLKLAVAVSIGLRNPSPWREVKRSRGRRRSRNLARAGVQRDIRRQTAGADAPGVGLNSPVADRNALFEYEYDDSCRRPVVVIWSGALY